MTGDNQRTRAGQFAPGHSGNAAGARSRKPKRLMTLEDIYRTILEIAASDTKLANDTKVQRISILERNMWVLASGKGNRLAAKDFMDLSRSAGAYFENRERYPLRPRSSGGSA